MIVDELKKSILKEAFSNGFNNYSFEEKKFKDVFSIINGFTPLRSDSSLWSKDEVNWFTVDDYNEQGYIINYTKQHISNKAIGNNSSRVLPVGTVILCCTSATIGTSAICNIPMTTNQQFNGLVANKGYAVDTKYLYYYTLTLRIKMKNDSTSTTFPFLSVKNLEKYNFPYIYINKQKEIANKIEQLFLKLDEIKPIENEIIALRNNFSNDLRKSIIQSACNGNLSIQHDDESVIGILNAIKIKNNKEINIVHNKVPFPIPDNWVWIRFDDLVSFDIGKTPARADSTYWGNDYHWISISDMVEDGLINETKEGVSQKAFDNIFKGKISKKGTLIMSFKLTVGRCSLLNIDAFHNEGIISIYPNYESEILKKYLMKILPFITKYGDTKGAIKGNTLNSKSLKELLIPLPPIEEQQRIIEKIEELLPLCNDIDNLVKE